MGRFALSNQRVPLFNSQQRQASMFSTGIDGEDEPLTRKNVASRVIEATLDALDSYTWHLYPELRFAGMKGVTYQPDGTIDNAEIMLNASLRTFSGVNNHFQLPAQIRKGEVLTPSSLINDRGQLRVLAQSSIDAVQTRGSFWQQMDPRGHMYSPPLPMEVLTQFQNLQGEGMRYPRFNAGPYRIAQGGGNGDENSNLTASLTPIGTENIIPLYNREGQTTDEDALDPAERPRGHGIGSSVKLKTKKVVKTRGGSDWTIPGGSKGTIKRDVFGDGSRYLVDFDTKGQAEVRHEELSKVGQKVCQAALTHIEAGALGKDLLKEAKQAFSGQKAIPYEFNGGQAIHVPDAGVVMLQRGAEPVATIQAATVQIALDQLGIVAGRQAADNLETVKQILRPLFVLNTTSVVKPEAGQPGDVKLWTGNRDEIVPALESAGWTLVQEQPTDSSGRQDLFFQKGASKQAQLDSQHQVLESLMMPDSGGTDLSSASGTLLEGSSDVDPGVAQQLMEQGWVEKMPDGKIRITDAGMEEYNRIAPRASKISICNSADALIRRAQGTPSVDLDFSHSIEDVSEMETLMGPLMPGKDTGEHMFFTDGDGKTHNVRKDHPDLARFQRYMSARKARAGVVNGI